MKKILITLLRTALLMLLTPLAAAEPQILQLDDFTYGASLSPVESEFRRFSLSPMMIKDVQRRDLGDVRVFDGDNKLMPTLVRRLGAKNKASQQTLMPYPYRVSGVTAGYILDRSDDHKQSLKSLNLLWKQGAVPRILTVRVEHSADQKSWKTLIDSETVINFNLNGSVLKQNRIDINNYTHRYIKLTFLNIKKVPVLASVEAYSTARKLLDDFWLPTGQLQPDDNITNGYRFSVSKAISPSQIKLSFAKLNTVLSGSLSTIEVVNDKLKRKMVINDFDAYVVTINNQVVKSKPINVSRWESSEWLMTINSENDFSEDGLPSITVAYPHYEVIYASDGVEPYTVVWGNSTTGAPKAGDFVKRLRSKSLTRKDIAVTKTGITLDNASLKVLKESRQTSWLMLLLGVLVIIIVATASIFLYKRR